MAKKTVRILRSQDIHGIWYQPNQLVELDTDTLATIPEASYDAAKKAVDYIKSEGGQVINHVNPDEEAAKKAEAEEAAKKAEAEEAAKKAEAEEAAKKAEAEEAAKKSS